MPHNNLIELERSKFEFFFFFMEQNKFGQSLNAEVLLRRWKAEELNECEQSFVGEYFNDSIQEKWSYWLASAQSKYEQFVLMPKEPNGAILSEIELVDGWTQLALTTRYKAMLAAAQKIFFQ